MSAKQGWVGRLALGVAIGVAAELAAEYLISQTINATPPNPLFLTCPPAGTAAQAPCVNTMLGTATQYLPWVAPGALGLMIGGLPGLIGAGVGQVGLVLWALRGLQ